MSPKQISYTIFLLFVATGSACTSLEKKAQRGDPQAQYELAKHYEHNLLLPETALTWYKKAAENGHADALSRLGDYYHYDLGEDGEAISWHRRAADSGSVESQWKMWRYTDDEKYLKMAATNNHKAAQSALAEKAVTSKVPEPPKQTHEEADAPIVELNGNTTSESPESEQTNLGSVEIYPCPSIHNKQSMNEPEIRAGSTAYSFYEAYQTTEKSRKELWNEYIFERCILKDPSYFLQSFKDAMLYDEDEFYRRRIVASGNPAHAIEILEERAKNETDIDKSAQLQLAMCYKEGIGVPANPERAVEIFKKLVEQGYRDAEWQLGVCYQEGLGVPHNPRKGFEWIKTAAESGQWDARLNLAHCYWRGIGVNPNKEEARRWALKCIKKFHRPLLCASDIADRFSYIDTLKNIYYDWNFPEEVKKAIRKGYIFWVWAISDPRAQYELGNLYLECKDLELAAEYFYAASKWNYLDSEIMLYKTVQLMFKRALCMAPEYAKKFDELFPDSDIEYKYKFLWAALTQIACKSDKEELFNLIVDIKSDIDTAPKVNERIFIVSDYKDIGKEISYEEAISLHPEESACIKQAILQQRIDHTLAKHDFLPTLDYTLIEEILKASEVSSNDQ